MPTPTGGLSVDARTLLSLEALANRYFAQLQEATEEPPKATGSPLLQCNDRPSATEIQAIRQSIQVAQAALDNLSQQIKPETSEYLRPLVEACSDFVQAHTNLLRGPRILPDELLEAIFLHALEGKHRHRTLASIVRTCRRWKVIAENYPLLWSTLPTVATAKQGPCAMPLVMPTAVGAKRAEGLLRAVEVYLKRSKACPLRFVFAFVYEQPEDDPERHVTSILIHLIAHSPRWADVSLIVSMNVLRFMSSIDGRLPSLHTLSLRVLQDGSTNRILSFASCPNLRKLTIEYLNDWIPGEDDMLFSLVSIPWEQLATFEYATWGPGRTTIEKSDALTRNIRCHVSAPDPGRLSRALTRFPSMTVTGADIAFRTRRNEDQELVRWFADELVLPGLRYLKIGSYTAKSRDVVTFIRNSKCHLETLILDFWEYPESPDPTDAFADLLSQCEQLEELRCTLLHPKDLQRLKYVPSDPKLPLAPRLRTLVLNLLGELHEPIPETVPQILNSAEINEVLLSRANGIDVSGVSVPALNASIRCKKPETLVLAFHALECSAPHSTSFQDTFSKWSSKLTEMHPFHRSLSQQPITQARGEDFGNVIETFLLRMLQPVDDAALGVEGLLGEMEEYILKDDDVPLLQEWEIPFLVDENSSAPPRTRRMVALREKWTPIIRTRMANTQRWFFKGREELVFLSDDKRDRGVSNLAWAWAAKKCYV